MSKQSAVSRVGEGTAPANLPAMLEQFRVTGCPVLLERILTAMGNPPQVFEAIRPYLFSKQPTKQVSGLRKKRTQTEWRGIESATDAPDEPAVWLQGK